MHNRSNFFSQNAGAALNEYQQFALREFAADGLTAQYFTKIDWFNESYHQRTLSYLIKFNKHTIAEALTILKHLNKDQAEGVLQGLNIEEVLDLQRDQINAILKHGLAKEKVIGLNTYAIRAILLLGHLDLKPDDLRNQPWFNSDSYVFALCYLMTNQHMPSHEAIATLSDSSELQAKAIYFGLKKEDILDLKKHQLVALLERKKYEGLSDVRDLSDAHITLIKNLYHWGVTRNFVLQNNWLNTTALCDTFTHLVKQGRLIADCVCMLQGLNDTEAHGIMLELTKAEVVGLNAFQIKALSKSRTIKNGLCAEHFHGKDWFNSTEHVHALHQLLYWEHMTVEAAMAELHGLNHHQANQIAEGQKRDNIIDLTEWQLKSVQELKYDGLTGSHLRNKNWFNSANHYQALNVLIKMQKLSVDEALIQIDRLNEDQAALMQEGCTKEIILTLTPVQIKVFNNRNLHLDKDKVINATWLTTDQHYLALEQLCQRGYRLQQKALEIVEKVNSTETGVAYLLLALKNENNTDNTFLELLNVPAPTDEPFCRLM